MKDGGDGVVGGFVVGRGLVDMSRWTRYRGRGQCAGEGFERVGGRRQLWFKGVDERMRVVRRRACERSEGQGTGEASG